MMSQQCWVISYQFQVFPLKPWWHNIAFHPTINERSEIPTVPSSCPGEDLKMVIEFNFIISTKLDWNIAHFLLHFLSLESAILVKRAFSMFPNSVFPDAETMNVNLTFFFSLATYKVLKPIKKLLFTR